MRFGRILLASLTAFAAYSYAQNAPSVRPHDPFPRLLQVVVPLFVAATESAAAPPILKAPPQSILALDGPAPGSLLLVASTHALDLSERTHPRLLLRC